MPRREVPKLNPEGQLPIKNFFGKKARAGRSRKKRNGNGGRKRAKIVTKITAERTLRDMVTISTEAAKQTEEPQRSRVW